MKYKARIYQQCYWDYEFEADSKDEAEWVAERQAYAGCDYEDLTLDPIFSKIELQEGD